MQLLSFLSVSFVCLCHCVLCFRFCVDRYRSVSNERCYNSSDAICYDRAVNDTLRFFNAIVTTLIYFQTFCVIPLPSPFTLSPESSCCGYFNCTVLRFLWAINC